MTNKDLIFDYLKPKMKAAGFILEKEQKSHMQNRGWELKYIHPKLVKKLRKEEYKVRGEKFYIKSLSDEYDIEIGFVNGKLSQLDNGAIFCEANSHDTFDKSPAWVNREENQALDNLLSSIQNYLNYTG